MIKLNALSFNYAGAKDAIIDRLDLSVREGECVLITGASGCGKTTLTRILNGLCPKFYEGKISGNYFLDGREVSHISIDEIGTILGSVFQDPRSQFFASNVQDEIVLAMENNNISRKVMHERLEEVCERLNISHLLNRSMQNLSSGEKQKIAIASVYAMQPKGLVLDEPSANLDADATQQLAVLLDKLKKDGHTLVLSEHRLHYLKDVFDRLIIMKNGKIYKEYSRDEALSLSDEQMMKMGLRLFNTPKITTSGRIYNYDNCVLKADQVGLIRDGKQIVYAASVGFKSGKITGITGSNGAGKTSICKILAGVTKESAGGVFIDGEISRRKKRIRNSFLVGQDVDYQLYTTSVEEEILLGTKEKISDIQPQGAIERLNLLELLNRHPNTLSGGQKQRVLIAASCAHNAKTVIFDEPTSGLDGDNMRSVAKILKELAEYGKAIILITHDIEFIHLVATDLLHISDGKIGYHHILNPKEHEDLTLLVNLSNLR